MQSKIGGIAMWNKNTVRAVAYGGALLCILVIIGVTHVAAKHHRTEAKARHVSEEIFTRSPRTPLTLVDG